VSARYIARCSYGNDSIAMLQLLKEHRLKDVTVVYSKTGWSSLEWIDRVEKGEAWVRLMGWRAVTLTSDGFEHMVLTQTKDGMFPTRIRKFCTKYLKIKPFLKWVAEFDPDRRAVVCVGVRRAESLARVNHPAFMPEQDNGRHVWHPLIEFSDEDRDAMILKTPLPILDHRSDECEICVNSNRNDLRRASEFSIARLERLEKDVGRPMFDPKGKMGATGIREVIAWAKSERGQYQPDKPDPYDPGPSCEDGWCGS
jgi:3'-phosphoadenosine 5'-phosphosulfate sulfotransferase (PAPS reductase)/FAD synthetase